MNSDFVNIPFPMFECDADSIPQSVVCFHFAVTTHDKFHFAVNIPFSMFEWALPCWCLTRGINLKQSQEECNCSRVCPLPTGCPFQRQKVESWPIGLMKETSGLTETKFCETFQWTRNPLFFIPILTLLCFHLPGMAKFLENFAFKWKLSSSN